MPQVPQNIGYVTVDKQFGLFGIQVVHDDLVGFRSDINSVDSLKNELISGKEALYIIVFLSGVEMQPFRI